MKPIVSSATAWRFTPGVQRTATPWRRAASRSIMSRPTPYLLTTRSSGTAAKTALVEHFEAGDRLVVAAQERDELVAAQRPAASR